MDPLPDGFDFRPFDDTQIRQQLGMQLVLYHELLIPHPERVCPRGDQSATQSRFATAARVRPIKFERTSGP